MRRRRAFRPTPGAFARCRPPPTGPRPRLTGSAGHVGSVAGLPWARSRSTVAAQGRAGARRRMSRRRIELSATQVIASMLAAVTGAVAASYAGIGGTVIGVAVMSVASTAGAAFYQHYLGRSKERLRSAAVVIAPVIAPRANINGSPGHRGRGTGAHAQAPGGQTRAAGNPDGAAGSQDRAAGDQNLAGRQARVPGTTGSAPYPAREAGQFTGWPWSPDSPVTEGV